MNVIRSLAVKALLAATICNFSFANEFHWRLEKAAWFLDSFQSSKYSFEDVVPQTEKLLLESGLHLTDGCSAAIELVEKKKTKLSPFSMILVSTALCQVDGVKFPETKLPIK